ncbi:hypothetical protein [Larkinella humicola]|uniref:Uncharacterized protein n=1 Tax=Larkinella humicola TaxID=2607654 RepID=A0A5N1JM35_9BACT|nr:hypothetical protein [Larkinella humicola]KAA9357264.1 hypothetical protein F0P93_05880 [Larkinella humicola]
MITIITIPQALPSLNAIRKMHKGDYKKLRDMLQQYARMTTRYRHPGRITIEYYRYSPGVLDFDNLAGSGKILLDACRFAGLIIDDRPGILLRPHYENIKIKRGEQPQSVLKIIDLD